MDSEVVEEVMVDTGGSQTPAFTLPPEEVHTGPIPAEEAKESISLVKAIASLWADRSAAMWKPLEYPM